MDWTIWASAVVVVAVPGALACMLLKRMSASRTARVAAPADPALVRREDLAGLEERITRLTNALSLLTDTAESGLREAFGEIERLAQENRARVAPQTLQQRIETATRAGHPARSIAAAEGLSESEVLLRLGLSAAAARTTHAAVR